MPIGPQLKTEAAVSWGGRRCGAAETVALSSKRNVLRPVRLALLASFCVARPGAFQTAHWLDRAGRGLEAKHEALIRSKRRDAACAP